MSGTVNRIAGLLRRMARIALYCALLSGFALFLVTCLTYALTDTEQYRSRNPGKTAYMKYEEARAASKGSKHTIRQRWVPLRDISPYLVQAVLIAEDDRFYEHWGLDLKALWEALRTDVAEGKFKFGASTLTQQLARNLYLSPSKNPLRKAREAAIALKLERTLGKRRILELYLNVVQWDEDVYGAEAAALKHFGKHASALSAEEAARMAIVLPSPRRYDPLAGSKFIDQRWRAVYAIMLRRGLAGAPGVAPQEPAGEPSEGGEKNK